MKTEDVYFAKIYRISGIGESDYFKTMVELDYVKHALVQHRVNIFGLAYMKDLNTNEKYKLSLSNKVGTLYVSHRSIESFNDVTENKEQNLPKQQIKVLGNKYIKDKEK